MIGSSPFKRASFHGRQNRLRDVAGGTVIRSTGVLTESSSLFGTTKLDKIKNFHSADSIDTESLSTRGRSVWVHSRLLDSSVPAGEGGAVGNGVARSLGAEPGYAVRS